MKTFDQVGFRKAIMVTIDRRGLSFETATAQAGVYPTLLTKMQTESRIPDATSLLALSTWADLDPRDFWVHSRQQPEISTKKAIE